MVKNHAEKDSLVRKTEIKTNKTSQNYYLFLKILSKFDSKTVFYEQNQ